MPLPQKERRSCGWWITLLMFAAFFVAVIVAFVLDYTSGNPDEPHRPPHVTSTK